MLSLKWQSGFYLLCRFLHLDSNMPLCYSAIPSRSLRRDGADLKGVGISRQAFCRAKFAFAQRSGAMKAPVGLLSDRTVLRQQDGGASPRQVPLMMRRMQTMQGKKRLSRRCAKVCRAPENGKSHEESQIHSHYRKIHICTHRIICIQCNHLQRLSGHSGVQKVCKNVQTGKTKPNGQINHRFYGRV